MKITVLVALLLALLAPAANAGTQQLPPEGGLQCSVSYEMPFWPNGESGVAVQTSGLVSDCDSGYTSVTFRVCLDIFINTATGWYNKTCSAWSTYGFTKFAKWYCVQNAPTYWRAHVETRWTWQGTYSGTQRFNGANTPILSCV